MLYQIEITGIINQCHVRRTKRVCLWGELN